MKNRRTAVLLSLALLIGSAPMMWSQAAKKPEAKAPARVTTGAIPSSWQKVPIPPLPAWKPEQPTRFVLKNGMVIYLMEDHELPLVSGVAYIRGGATAEPANKVGMMSIYSQVWRTGGTKDMTGDQMDEFLEARAAKIETDAGNESTSIGFDCLKGDFNDVFKMFVDLMQNPDFRQDKIDLAKSYMNTAISRRNDSSGQIVSREAGFLAYGKNNPYVREMEYSTVAAVTRQDLVNWHKDHVFPNDIMLGISGDFDTKQMEAKLEEAFGGWAKGPEITQPEVEFHPAKPGIYVVNKADVNQSEIRMVELGIKRSNPDWFAVQVFNEVFGGGFSSRLFNDLRTKQGLAYSVGGGIGSSMDHPGITQLGIGTKSESTIPAIKGLWAEIGDLKTNPPTEAELKRAKDTILNGFIFNYNTPDKVLREKMTLERYGYPADFLEKFQSHVEKVTTADLERVALKYLHKDQLAVLVVGKAADWEKQLAELGPVTNLDITIPVPGEGAKAEAAPKASNPEGKALMAKFVQFLGGEANVQAVKAMHEVSKQTVETPQGQMTVNVDETIVLPDKMMAKIGTPMGEMTRVVTPDVAYMAMGGQSRDLPASMKEQALEQIARHYVSIAQHVNDSSLEFVANGTAKVGDKDAAVVDVYLNGKKVTWYLDPTTGALLREQQNVVGQTGPAEVTTDLSDWKTVNGVNFAMKGVTMQNGKQAASTETQTVEVNPQVDPKVFTKPQ